MILTMSQTEALEAFRAHARARKAKAQAALAHALRMANVSAAAFAHGVAQLNAHARVALHFHPDRLGPGGESVAQALLGQGVYKSQFETFISNGSVSARAGGERDLWENRLFGGAYDLSRCGPHERPKYGALDLLGHADGPAPRFGSCRVILKPATKSRCTFTYRDSCNEPAERGTLDEFDDVLGGLLTDVLLRETALGEPRLSVRALVERLSALSEDATLRDGAPMRGNLNEYIEAQVHGAVDFRSDVEAVVIDPCFVGTPTGDALGELCARHGLALRTHAGYRLRPDQVPDDFRGPTMPALAARVAVGGTVDARAVGAAAVAVKTNPEAWRDLGTAAEVLQELKFLWHVLVRFGNCQVG